MAMRFLKGFIVVITVLIGIVLLSFPLSFLFLDRDIYIIPKGYQGCALIIFDVEGGTKEKHDKNGNRIYELPTNGILEVEYSPNYGTKLPPKYYTRGEQGRLEQLNYVHPAEWNNKYPDSSIVVSTSEYGESYKPWESFVVSRYKGGISCDRRYYERIEYMEKFKNEEKGQGGSVGSVSK